MKSIIETSSATEEIGDILQDTSPLLGENECILLAFAHALEAYTELSAFCEPGLRESSNIDTNAPPSYRERIRIIEKTSAVVQSRFNGSITLSGQYGDLTRLPGEYLYHFEIGGVAHCCYVDARDLEAVWFYEKRRRYLVTFKDLVQTYHECIERDTFVAFRLEAAAAHSYNPLLDLRASGHPKQAETVCTASCTSPSNVNTIERFQNSKGRRLREKTTVVTMDMGLKIRRL